MAGNGDEWGTPPWVYDWASSIWGPFTLDAAASHANTKCSLFISKETNALEVDWRALNGRVWLNPPYSTGNLKAFCRKAVKECYLEKSCTLVCALLKDDRSTNWYWDWVKHTAAVECPLPRRVKHIGPDGESMGTPNFPSMIVVWFRGP